MTGVRTHTGATMSRWLLIISTQNILSPGLRTLKNLVKSHNQFVLTCSFHLSTVAFLFGIISHQVSDISWHGLEGLKDGYLDVLGKLAFHGSFGDAHNYGDVADDMIGVFEWNVTSYAYEWYVPTQVQF